MGATVAVGGMELSSNNESGEQMLEALKAPEKDEAKQPRLVEPETQQKEEDPLSKAASELGKAGGAAAAKARKEREAQEAAGAPKEARDEPETEGDEKKAVTGEQESEEEKRGHRREDPRTRIMQQARELAEERRVRQELEARLHALEERVKPKEEKPAAAQVAEDDEPHLKPEIHDTYEAGIEAYVKAAVDKGVEKGIERKLAEIVQQANLQKEAEARADRLGSMSKGFAERLKKAVEVEPDFMEKVDKRLLSWEVAATVPPGAPLGPQNFLAQAMLDSDHGPAMLRYLSEHEDEVVRILQMRTPGDVMRAMGRIEAKVAAAAEAPPVERRPSSAPPPLRPVQPSAVPGEADVYGEIDFDSFATRRRLRR